MIDSTCPNQLSTNHQVPDQQWECFCVVNKYIKYIYIYLSYRINRTKSIIVQRKKIRISKASLERVFPLASLLLKRKYFSLEAAFN